MRVTDTASFIAKSKIVHGDRYDYSKSKYINARTKVAIMCKTHGVFHQNPRTHIKQKSGCPSCGGTKKLTQSEFIEKCSSIHKNRYDYSISNYENSNSILEIICKEHGVFLQVASEHARGHGCYKCGSKSSGFGKDRFINACDKNNGLGVIYLIECNSRDELFYKIGITSKTIKSRIVNIPYECTVLSYVRTSALNVFMTEKRIHKKLKAFRYKPSLFFFGRTECFSELTQEVKDFFGVQDA